MQNQEILESTEQSIQLADFENNILLCCKYLEQNMIIKSITKCKLTGSSSSQILALLGAYRNLTWNVSVGSEVGVRRREYVGTSSL